MLRVMLLVGHHRHRLYTTRDIRGQVPILERGRWGRWGQVLFFATAASWHSAPWLVLSAYSFRVPYIISPRGVTAQTPIFLYKKDRELFLEILEDVNRGFPLGLLCTLPHRESLSSAHRGYRKRIFLLEGSKGRVFLGNEPFKDDVKNLFRSTYRYTFKEIGDYSEVHYPAVSRG